jgi:hypothetical protein
MWLETLHKTLAKKNRYIKASMRTLCRLALSRSVQSTQFNNQSPPFFNRLPVVSRSSLSP